MARRFLITGTDTGIGKTRVACALASLFRSRGMSVGAMKPIETGCDDLNAPADALALKEAALSPDPLDLVCPYRYQAPLAPAMAAELANLPCPNPDRIRRSFDTLIADKEIVLVEGAGGLAVPITWNFNYADLARVLRLDLVVVVGNRLGCLNITALTLDYALRRGLFVRGLILNQPQPDDSFAARTNLTALARLTSVPCLGSIEFNGPFDAEIAGRLQS